MAVLTVVLPAPKGQAMTFGEALIQSAKEALAIAEGKAAPAAIRKRQRLSQAAFAARYGLSAGTVKDREQNRRQPDRAAALLLKIIEHSPELAARAIRA